MARKRLSMSAGRKPREGGRARSLMAAALLLAAACGHAHDLKGIDYERRTKEAQREQPSLIQTAAPLDNARAGLDAQVRATDMAIRVVEAAAIRLAPNGVESKAIERMLGARPFSVIVDPWVWDMGTVLKVCFFQNGFASTKQAIVQVASQWSKHGNVSFNFGPHPNYWVCSAGDKNTIRVSLTTNGYFSLIGREAQGKDVANEVTMALEDIDKLDPAGAQFKWLVLHEFGHALGLAHEHSNPNVVCMPQYNLEKIAETYNWSVTEARKNMETITVSNVVANGKFFQTGTGSDGMTLTFSDYDKDSVMHYHLKADAFNEPPGSCYNPVIHAALSPRDQEAVARAYPSKKDAAKHNLFIENTIKANPDLSRLEKTAFRLLQRKVP